MTQLVKNPPAMWETWVLSLGWEGPLEKGMATTSVFWPGEFHGLYSPWGHKELDTTEWLWLSFVFSSPKLINLSGCSITLTHDYRAKSLCWENQKVHCEVTGTRCLVCELGVPRLCHQGRGCSPCTLRVEWVRRSSHLCRDFWEHFTASSDTGSPQRLSPFF